jgi:hypothetical protein
MIKDVPLWVALAWSISVALTAFFIGKTGRSTPAPPPARGGWMRDWPAPPRDQHPLDLPRVTVHEVRSKDDHRLC